MPHEFEDGFVERTLAIIVRDKTAYVEYSVGLNEQTMRDILAKWEAPDPDEAPQDHGLGSPKDRAEIEPTGQPSESSPFPTADAHSALVRNKQSPGDVKSITAIDPIKPELAATLDEEGGAHFISPEVLERFKRIAPETMTNNLNISCNDRPVTVIALSEGVAPRHPFTLSVKFQFKLPESESCDLKVEDKNFAQQTGAVRLALKATGQAMLLRSNVAPILVRADRVELNLIPIENRKSVTTIEARIAVPQID